jgi:hypothetical protein
MACLLAYSRHNTIPRQYKLHNLIIMHISRNKCYFYADYTAPSGHKDGIIRTHYGTKVNRPYNQVRKKIKAKQGQVIRTKSKTRTDKTERLHSLSLLHIQKSRWCSIISIKITFISTDMHYNKIMQFILPWYCIVSRVCHVFRLDVWVYACS